MLFMEKNPLSTTSPLLHYANMKMDFYTILHTHYLTPLIRTASSGCKVVFPLAYEMTVATGFLRARYSQPVSMTTVTLSPCRQPILSDYPDDLINRWKKHNLYPLHR